MKFKIFFVISVFILMILSCGMPVSKFGQDINDEENNIESTNIIEESNLFLNEEKENEFDFETNEQKFLSQNGWTLFTTPFENASDNFEDFSVTVCKESGSVNAGYGIVFCRQIYEDKEFMICVLIDTRGNYIVGKIINNHFYKRNNWTRSQVLKTGFGIKNKITAQYNTENKGFNLYFNDYLEYSFFVEENISFKDNKAGYVVVISDTEKLPSVSVKVSFNQN